MKTITTVNKSINNLINAALDLEQYIKDCDKASGFVSDITITKMEATVNEDSYNFTMTVTDDEEGVKHVKGCVGVRTKKYHTIKVVIYDVFYPGKSLTG